MSILKTKKGIGIPTVLGIVTFVIATVATLLTVAVNQSKLIDRSIESSEAYANAVQDVDATLKIIARDQNLDPAYLDALELYMGVTIQPYVGSLYMISSMVTSSRTVVGYISSSADIISIYDDLLSNTTTILGPNSDITPTSLLASYLPIFMNSELPGVAYPDTFANFDAIVDYIRQLALSNNGFTRRFPSFLQNQVNPTVNSNLYIEGSVVLTKNKDLTVNPGYLLVINGNLTTNENSIISGNIVVNGTVTIIGKGNSVESLLGTLYVDGNVTTGKSIQLGTNIRPTFIFSEGNITFGNTVVGVGYFVSDNFTANQGNVYITGGVYVTYNASLPSSGIATQTDLNETLLYDYAIPQIIVVEDEAPLPGESNFVYTFPKLT